MTSDEQLYWNPVSTFLSADLCKKAVVCVDSKACYYFVDFYFDEKYIDTTAFPGKSLRYVEDAAENYTLGILNVN